MRGGRLPVPAVMAISAISIASPTKAREEKADVLKRARALVRDIERSAQTDRELLLGRLASLGPAAIPVIREAAGSPNAGVARSARSLLGAWERYSALREEVVEQTEEVEKASAALKAVGPLGFDVIVAAYRSGAPDNWRVGEKIIGLAAEIDPERALAFFETILAGESKMMKWRTLHALGRIPGERSARLAVSALLHGESNTRLQAKIALGRIGEPAVGPLLDVLASPDARERRLAAEAFYKFKPLVEKKSPLLGQVVGALVRARGKDIAEVRGAAVPSLARLSWERFRESLDHEDPAVREAAVRYLRQQRISGQTEVFLAALRDPAPGVRVEAARALDHHRLPRVIEALTVALDGESPQVRAECARALGYMAGHARALKDATFRSQALPVEKLLAMARDEKEPEVVRDAAAEAVMRIDDPRTYEFAKENVDHKKLKWLVAHRLAQSGRPEAAHLIASMLADKVWYGSASEQLAKMGKVVVPALERAFAEGPKEVRTRVLWTIEKMRGKDIFPLVTCALDDADLAVRALAAKVAGTAGNKQAMRKLVDLLDERDESVRMAAASSLTMLGDDRAKARAVAFHCKAFRAWFTWPYDRGDAAAFLADFALRPGMTKKEVAELLGYPHGTEGKADRWFYSVGFSQFVTLRFVDDKLVDLDGTCASWRRPPDDASSLDPTRPPGAKPQP